MAGTMEKPLESLADLTMALAEEYPDLPLGTVVLVVTRAARKNASFPARLLTLTRHDARQALSRLAQLPASIETPPAVVSPGASHQGRVRWYLGPSR